MRKPKFYYYNKEICKQASLEYKNRRDFYKHNSAAANAALINGWIDEFFPPLKNHSGYWTYDTCKEESLKYQTKKEFREKSYSAYCAIHRLKISKDVINNMKSSYRTVGQFTLDNIFIKCYDTTGLASKETGIKQSSISLCCNKKYKSAGGFIWKYL